MHMCKIKFVTLRPTTHSEETDTPSLSLPPSDAVSHEQLRNISCKTRFSQNPAAHKETEEDSPT